MCVLSLFISLQYYAILWTVAHETPLSTGFSRQKYWAGLPCPPPGDLPDPGTAPMSLMSPVLAGRFQPLGPPGKTHLLEQNSEQFLLITSISWLNTTHNMNSRGFRSCCLVAQWCNEAALQAFIYLFLLETIWFVFNLTYIENIFIIVCILY